MAIRRRGGEDIIDASALPPTAAVQAEGAVVPCTGAPLELSTTTGAAVRARGTHDESIRLSHRSAVAGCAARAHAAMPDAKDAGPAGTRPLSIIATAFNKNYLLRQEQEEKEQKI